MSLHHPSSVPAPPPVGSTPEQIVSVKSPADVLSYVPHALGFTPAESLVVMTMAGKRLGATLRVDLPTADPLGEADAVAFSEAVLSFLRGDPAADGVLLIVYTQSERTQFAPPPRDGLVRALGDVLRAAGLPVRSGWLVSGDVWRDYFCTDEACCPWPGHPLDTVVDSYLNAEMILGGSSFDASAAAAVLRSAPHVARHVPLRDADGDADIDGGTDAAPDARAVEEVEEAQAYFAAACAGHWDEAAQLRATSMFWDAVLEQQCVVGMQDRQGVRDRHGAYPRSDRAASRPSIALPTRLDAESVGFLLASIESRTIRDFLLVSACLGSRTALEGICAADAPIGTQPAGVPTDAPGAHVLPAVAAGWRPGSFTAEDRQDQQDESGARRTQRCETTADSSEPAVRRLFAEVLAGLHRGPVDWTRVDGMTELLIALVSLAGTSGESRAAALTMLGWFDYARGRGSRAAVYFDAAEEALPGYRLARLLNELLSRGGLPEWARHRSTAWRPTTATRVRRAA